VLTFEAVVYIDMYPKVSEDRVKVGILVYIRDWGEVREPSLSMSDKRVIGILEVGGFLSPAFGEGSKLVYGDVDAKYDGEGGDGVGFKLQTFSACRNREEIVGVSSIYDRMKELIGSNHKRSRVNIMESSKKNI
jgi:hypothetical protein